MSDTINEIRGLLEEIYGFKATSKVEQDNLNAALDLLDEVQPRLKLLAESVLESHNPKDTTCLCPACTLAREIVK